jgi:hypothetical protein
MQVRVPRVTGFAVGRAYSRVHRAGLRVSYTRSFFEGSFECGPTVGGQRPAAGRVVSPASTVVLTPRRSFCVLGSPGVPVGRLPSARVPNFAGKTVLLASRWADRHRLYWQAGPLPPLRSGDADELLANYAVRSQAPHPGSIRKLGIAGRLGRNSGSFRPTPLVLRATQTRQP